MALRTEDETDSKNAGQADYDRKVNAIKKAEENAAFDSIAGNNDKTSDGSSGGGVQKVSDSESIGGGAQWINSVSKPDIKAKGRLSGLKKKGPIGIIIAIIVGGVGFGGMFSGANLIINLKEQLSSNIMDASSSVFNLRGKQLLKSKLGSMTSGACNVITIRCKFKTMSNRQISKLERAGIKVNKSGTSIIGRAKVASLEFDGKTINSNNVFAEARNNPKFASALNKSFNPRFYAWTNSSISKLYSKIGIKKTKALQPSADKNQMRAGLKDNIAGRAGAMQAAGLKANYDGDTLKDYTDERTGKTISIEEADNRMSVGDSNYKQAVETKKAAASAGNVAGKVTGAALKGTLLIGTGLVDSLCTGWMVIRTAAFTAKYLGSLQLIRYASVFLNTADAIKSGDASPEEVAYLGEILMSQNSEGKTAMDSRGWNYVMYGDVTPIPQLGELSEPLSGDDFLDGKLPSDDAIDQELIKAETTNYVNGQITSDTIMGQLASFIDTGGGGKEAADATCGFVKSGWGQATVIGVGVVALAGCAITAIIGVGVACFTANTAISASISIAIGVTVSLISPWLISLAADELITGFENGNEAGNAIVSGAGAMNTQAGLANGLGYMNSETAAEFAQVRSESREYFAMIDREDYSPFDTTNVNTFMGSIVSSLFPYITKMSSISSGISSIISLSTKTLLSPIQQPINAKTYLDANVCPDVDYREGDIATDINCNPLVGQSSDTLSIDVDEVLDYMESYINPISGEPAASGNKYDEYLKYCVERSMAFGAFEEGGDRNAVTLGEVCSEDYSGSDAGMYKMFRAYQSLFLANEGMDDEQTMQSQKPTTTRPDNVEDSHDGWTIKNNQDYTNIECDERTEDAGIVTAAGGSKIRLCKVVNATKYPSVGSNISVNSLISTNVVNMFEAAHAAGVTMGISSAYRNDSLTQHGRGLALDLGAPRGGSSICYTSEHTPSATKAAWEDCYSRQDSHGKAFAWLNRNASNYGFYNLNGDDGSGLYEAWHWSTSGR